MRATRREALRRIGGVGAVAALAGGAGFLLHGRDRRAREGQATLPSFAVERSAVHAQMAVARGGEAGANTRAAIDALGGMATFVRGGDRVLVKPNAAWKRIPEQAATTNPEVLAELVRLCRDAGASEVVVFDTPCDAGAATFRSSGIAEAVEGAGGKAMWPEPQDFVEASFGGKLLRRWPVWEELPRFDKVINVPIAKHHVQSRVTAGMKNWYGVLGGDRGLLHQDMDGSIVDLARAIVPTLTVVDAQRVLMRNGPTGGSLGDVKDARAVAAGVDPVALDAWATVELEQEVGSVPYLGKAEEAGLGVTAWRALRLKEVLGT